MNLNLNERLTLFCFCSFFGAALSILVGFYFPFWLSHWNLACLCIVSVSFWVFSKATNDIFWLRVRFIVIMVPSVSAFVGGAIILAGGIGPVRQLGAG